MPLNGLRGGYDMVFPAKLDELCLQGFELFGSKYILPNQTNPHGESISAGMRIARMSPNEILGAAGFNFTVATTMTVANHKVIPDVFPAPLVNMEIPKDLRVTIQTC